ncbi:type IX secretion system membrane protein, PorP/SprF family [Robiginitalea myxolifaciens]|uniref:Type IX secretion system membrane protein, PorP/SprF family n=1 Tax=Robiginitalea myxolifaciens TaxID=400055 RepID=A0A1I6H0R9_9FLAO|nr:PorP/SprF family type IX secretion system membrane protein [Robiginitalea myxolifaciens]SFR48010.1 type IX secretion system membrane protein, PorP/SprF family [Robiginitalea myxolifaciens]
MKASKFINGTLSGLLLAVTLLLAPEVTGQQTETEREFSVKSPFHNQLFFNRFLINPTFSLVRENKSYLNILHRNQYASFEDNIQNYYLGFSNRLNERTALGIGIYGQWEGVVQEFGFNANYARAIKLGDNSKLTFGTNITYVSQGLDQSRIITPETDPTLQDAGKESKIAVQPGIALTLGRFDLAFYGKELIKYNQTSNELITGFETANLQTALQYTQPLNATSGLFEDGRIMPMVQVGQGPEDRIAYIASLLVDLPHYGWLQSTYDATYGLSMGLGFNLSQTMSLGYLMEKDVTNTGSNLGWNHEISLAYTFRDEEESLKDYANLSQDKRIDDIIRNYEEQISQLRAEVEADRLASTQGTVAKNSGSNPEGLADLDATAKASTTTNTNPALTDELREGWQAAHNNKEDSRVARSGKRKAKTKLADADVAALKEDALNSYSLAFENRLILDELILRQDSIEAARTAQFEKRFETLVRTIRNEKCNGQTACPESKTQTPEERLPAGGARTAIAAVPTQKAPVNTQKTPNLKRDFKEVPIRSKNRSDIVGVSSGYYIIANVYSNKTYLNAFVKSLKEKGLNPKQFYNTENGLYYVYLADFNTKEDADLAHNSNLSGKYAEEKWIMEVYNPVATAKVDFLD